MATNVYLRFTLEHADGSTRELSVDADRAIVGSGAHCEIRLASDEVAVEQLRVEARGGAVFAEARSMTPPALLNGVPFTQGRLMPNTTLHLGSTQLRVEHADAGERPIVARAPKRKTNPFIWVLAGVGFPLGLYLVLASRPREAALGAAPRPPPLWSDTEAGPCPHEDRAVAEAQALSYLEQAVARRERSPFSPQDSVEAVSLYARAAACFAQASNDAEAGFAEREAEHMRRSTSLRFHVHQVRLERALATKDYDSAQAEARFLQAFVGAGGKEYGGWLSDLQRRIKLILASKNEKK